MKLSNLAIVGTLAVLTGCGGGSGGGGGNPGPGPGPGPNPSGITVNLQDRPGQVELTYLLGQGRSGVRAVGDVNAILNNRIAISGTGGSLSPVIGEQSYDIAKYSNNILRLNVPLNGADSVSFDTYTLALERITAELPDATVTSTNIDGLPYSVPVQLKVFPGRYTSLPIFINDGQFDIQAETLGDDSTTPPTPPTAQVTAFRPSVFLDDNGLNEIGPRLQGFLSDYLAFDITSMSEGDRPVLSDGTPAERIYLSGDNYAVSKSASGFGTATERGRFQLISRTISPEASAEFGPYIDGRYAPPRTFPGTDDGAPPSLTVPGTYSLIQDDPSQPPIDPEAGGDPAIAQIVSVQGIYRDYSRQLGNLPGEFAVALPSVRDDSVQDFLLIKQANGKVSAAYFGSVDLGTGELYLVPIRDLATADTTAAIVGSVSNLRGSSGATTTSVTGVRSGTYTLNGGTVPGFGRTGPFVVYRR